MRARILVMGGCGAAAVAGFVVILVLTGSLFRSRCNPGPIRPTSLQFPFDSLEPYTCDVVQGLLDADGRYWTPQADVNDLPSSAASKLPVNCQDGGVLEVPTTSSPPTIAYAVHIVVTVQLVEAAGSSLPTPASRPVPVGATAPDLCSGVPDGAVADPHLADFDARLWRYTGTDPDVPGQFSCGTSGHITKTPNAVTWTTPVTRRVLLVHGQAGAAPTPPTSFTFEPVECGSSAAGVVFDGAVYRPMAGATFPPGREPECMRNGSMLLDHYGYLHVYAPDGTSTALREYKGPGPFPGCG